MRRIAAIFLAISIASIAASSHGGDQKNAISAHRSSHKDSPAKPPAAAALQIVRVEPSPQSVEAEAEKQAAEDRVLGLKPDAWVAIFTLALTISTIGLWLTTRQMGRDAGEGIEAAKKSAEAANETAQAAKRQANILETQAQVLSIQKEIQRLQWLAEHRPRIKIRSIGITRERGQHVFQASRPIAGSLVITNGGAGDATILRAEYRFFISQKGLPMVPPLGEEEVKLLIPNGLPHTLIGHGSLQVPIEHGAMGARVNGIVNGIEKLYVMGAILYHGGDINMADGTMRERWMGFCREYIRPTIPGGDGYFAPVDNTDYEYSD